MDDYNELLKQYQRLLYYILNCFRVGNDEDMMQTAMIGLWKAQKSYDEDKAASFTTYMSTVITNEILMELNRRKRKNRLQPISLDYTYEGEESEIGSFRDSIATVDRAEENELYLDILSILSDEEEKLLKYVIAGYTQPELMHVYHVSQPSVCRKIKKLREKIQKYLRKVNISIK